MHVTKGLKKQLVVKSFKQNILLQILAWDLKIAT